MAYTYITSSSSPNHNQDNSLRHVEGITIHWWGLPSTGPTFQGTVNYLCRPGGNTSAHYVAEAGRVACIVDPDVIAWHAGNNVGNRTTIGIECNPLARDGDYQTVGELVRDLRVAYGDLPLYKHSYWKATACPGVYDLGRINAIATSTPVVIPEIPADILEKVLMRETFIGKLPDGSLWFVNMTLGLFKRLTLEQFNALGKRYGNDPELIVNFTQAGFDVLKQLAKETRWHLAEDWAN